MSTNTRVLIATVVALLFFIPYSYFMTPPQAEQKQTRAVDTNTTTSAPQTQSSTISAPTASTSQTPTTQTPQANDAEIIARIKSEHFDIEIDKLGRVSQYYLKDARFKTEHSETTALFSPMATPKPLEVRFSDNAVNELSFKTSYTADRAEIALKDKPETLILTQTLGELVFTKKITFSPNGAYNLKIELNQEKSYFLSPGHRPAVDLDDFVFKGALIVQADETIKKIEDGEASGNELFKGATVMAMVDRYYTTLMYNFEKPLSIALLKDENSNPLPFIEAKGNFEINGYIGGKEVSTLDSINPELKSVVDYGFITFFAKPLFYLLEWLYNITGNWGWSIVLLTIIIRVLMYPLTHKGMMSMQKLKEIAPKMKEVQEHYKGDPQKMQLHMMELYKKHGANPFGGCLPLILQMPVFFAIYRVLYNAIELKGADWILYITDLSLMDPYFILPILMGATMYYQQVITPTSFTDPMQAKIFKFLPLIFTFFFLTFPAGLVLYWLVNNMFSIAQQYFINKLFEKKKATQYA